MAETVEIPIHILKDGREFIAMMDYIDRSEVKYFVDNHPDYWELDDLRRGFVSPKIYNFIDFKTW